MGGGGGWIGCRRPDNYVLKGLVITLNQCHLNIIAIYCMFIMSAHK